VTKADFLARLARMKQENPKQYEETIEMMRGVVSGELKRWCVKFKRKHSSGALFTWAKSADEARAQPLPPSRRYPMEEATVVSVEQLP
jgi:hypothetical protein